MTTSTTRAAALCALLATTCLSAPALAVDPVPAPPVEQSVDSNGVDLVHGSFNISATDVSIGPDGRRGLVYARVSTGEGWRDSLSATISSGDGGTIIVSVGGSSDSFIASGQGYASTRGNGATLVQIGGGDFTYTSADGTKAVFFPANGQYDRFAADIGWIRYIEYPDGARHGFTYKALNYCPHEPDIEFPGCNQPVARSVRLQSASSNSGYRMKLTYASNILTHEGHRAAWQTLTNVTAYNEAVDYCDPSADTCNFTQAWPEATYGWSGGALVTATDPTGAVTSYAYADGRITGVRRPGATADDVTIAYDGAGRVDTLTRAGTAFDYGWADLNGERTMTMTGPLAMQRVVTSDIATALVKSDSDALGRTTRYEHDANKRLTKAIAPALNEIRYGYDSRGNVVETRLRDKDGNAANDIVTSAAFPAGCTEPRICNQPTSTTDARGFTTDYAYDPAHGGLLSVTLPAPSAGAVRPQTRLSYAARLAYYKNATGNIVASGTTIHLPTETSACQTLASCAGTADEVKTTIAYGPQTAGTGNNLLPVAVSSGAGDGSLTATTSMAYDVIGNLLTIDGPLAGTADTARARYDLRRSVVGTISPDPDGKGPLQHRAQRTTYRSDGRATKVESGNVAGQSDSDWTAFAAHDAVEMGYDIHGRPVTQKLVAGTTDYALTQTGYDLLGRSDCTTQRMNIAAFGALPASACIPGTEGAYGPDRISKTVYDIAGQVTAVRTALGTGLEAIEVATSYTDNGRIASVTDGESNRTDYRYDGHDRLDRIFFPVAAKGEGASNPNDWEGYGYDSGGNLLQRRLRDGQVMIHTYDALGRTTIKQAWALGIGVFEQTGYGYDLLGRLTSATKAGHALSFTYDAVGRNLTQTGPHGTTTSFYDVAGRRARLQYPGASTFYVDYDHLVTGEVTRVRENGAVSGIGVLAAYAYDSQGRRTGITRGNGTTTAYTYDPVSRLAALTETLAGTSQTLGFSYNPAAQIVGNTRSNDLFAWTGSNSGVTSSTVNGLNQLTQVGGMGVTHDTKGNTTSDGTKSYAYSSENLMTSAGGVTLSYDPLMRLYQAPSTRFGYDGTDLIHEYDITGAIQRRYVHGPGTDEPIILYENGDRRWLHADERGSIIAISDINGAVASTNTYDEYGKPASTNTGRFQYTGQGWIPEIGLYYYKARMYNPYLPRFMQSDRLGYGDGMNMYIYPADPVNFTDPSGMGRETLPPTMPEDGILVIGSPWRCYGCDSPLISLGLEAFLNSIGSGRGPTSYFDGIGVGGPTSENKTCTNGVTEMSTNRTDAGNVNVHISVPIQFDGAGADGSAAGYLSMINNSWSGMFGNYSVTTALRMGEGGLTGHISANSVMGNSRAQLGGREMWLGGLGNASVARSGLNGRIAAHEFGHTLGLKDRYSAGHPDPGYVGTIMGDGFGGAVTEKTIGEAIAACTESQG